MAIKNGINACILSLCCISLTSQALADKAPSKCPSLAEIQNTIWHNRDLREIKPEHMECNASGHCRPVKGSWELHASRTFDTDKTWVFYMFDLRANNLNQALETVALNMKKLTPAMKPEYDRMGYWTCYYGLAMASTRA